MPLRGAAPRPGPDGVLALRRRQAWAGLTVDLAARSPLIEGDDGSGSRRQAFRC
jgi:hypothetical protein